MFVLFFNVLIVIVNFSKPVNFKLLKLILQLLFWRKISELVLLLKFLSHLWDENNISWYFKEFFEAVNWISFFDHIFVLFLPSNVLLYDIVFNLNYGVDHKRCHGFWMREYHYCKLVKVRTLCILCNNWSLFVPRELMPSIAWHRWYTALVEFPRPDKIDHFIHTDRLASWVYLYDIKSFSW